MNIRLILGVCGMVGYIHASPFPKMINSVQDVVALFPQTVEEIEQRKKNIMEQVKKAVEEICVIPCEQRNYANTVASLDKASYFFSIDTLPISFLEYVSTDASLRKASHDASLELDKFSIDIFSSNAALYKAITDYDHDNRKNEKLTQEEQYLLEETIKGFKRSGHGLPQAEFERVIVLNKELSEIKQQFTINIAQDNRALELPREALQGLHEDFINSLKRNGDLYIVGTDKPTYFQVIESCEVETTRKSLYQLFRNKAYPINIELLNQLINKRDELARLLGFKSYADYDLDTQMVKTVSRAREFLKDIVAKATIKFNQEYQLLTSSLPAHITLVDNKIKPWDLAHITAQYKKKHFDIDERLIAEYFPVQSTIKGLISIYEQFMNIKIQEVPVKGLWHEDVTMLAVYDKQDRVRGYILLDLFPRENKYEHAAKFAIMRSIKTEEIVSPSVNCVVANFPKPTATKPALLQHSDVMVFFHEFGHAIHDVLGSTSLYGFSGTRTKTDFVELPSQMLEEWMWDEKILTSITSHYKTGESLPSDIIKKKIELKNFDSGYWLLRQLYFSYLSLEYFMPGAHKDTDAISRSIAQALLPQVVVCDTHQQANFGHLPNYGAKYYGYLWSKVFALDIFAQIEREGLLNPTIGTKYVDTILAPGGSVDPNVLLKNFLGRAPTTDAFFKSLGI